jgi:hypothetical protein
MADVSFDSKEKSAHIIMESADHIFTSVSRSSDPDARGSGQLHFILNITRHKSYTMRVEDVQLSLLPGRILTDDGGQVGCQDSMLSCSRSTRDPDASLQKNLILHLIESYAAGPRLLDLGSWTWSP